jgi:hypothetical protein
VTAANVHDSRMLAPLLDAMAPVRPGRSAPDRPQGHREQGPTRPASLGRGAHDGVARALPAVDGPL